MIRRPPRSPRPDTLLPYTTPFRPQRRADFMPPAEAGLRHHRARRHMADRDERDRHQQEEEAGIGDDPPLQAEPGDQQLRRGGGGESEDERDLREPVAHPVKKRAVGGDRKSTRLNSSP